LRSRAAWAHDEYSGLGANANFVSLPGFSFSVNGVTPAHDLLLASAGAELRFPNRVSVGAQFDSEFAERATKYSGKGVVRYSW
jgi:uncharacterized protein with beta-barrel porin domain